MAFTITRVNVDLDTTASWRRTRRDEKQRQIHEKSGKMIAAILHFWENHSFNNFSRPSRAQKASQTHFRTETGRRESLE